MHYVSSVAFLVALTLAGCVSRDRESDPQLSSLDTAIPLVVDVPDAVLDVEDAPADDSILIDIGTLDFPPIRPRHPTREWCEKMACGCGYGKWTAVKPLEIYGAEGDTTRLIETINRGDTLVAEHGFVHVVRPAVVVVTDSVTESYSYGKLWFQPGDVLFVVHNIGEGAFEVWFEGEAVEVEGFWIHEPFLSMSDPSGYLAASAELEWWVEVVTPSGKQGWLRVDDRDALVGPSQRCPRL